MSGFEVLKDILKSNREQKSVEEDALENDECPFDAWPLKVNPRTEQKSCELCGRIYR